MQIYSTLKFDKEYQKLPIDIKKRVKKQLALLVQFGPVYPSLRFKSIQKYKKEGLYEFSITTSYRVILQKMDNNEFNLLRVGPHKILDQL